jgi:putative heme iron utilization protein
MDAEAKTRLVSLLRQARVAALGTLRSDGGPLVSQVLFAAGPDFSSFYMHISRLAQHTQDLLIDSRASLMVAEPDDGKVDPQTLIRISLRGVAMIVSPDHDDYASARTTYLAKFPQAMMTFNLGDFALYCLEVKSARLVAGFGKTYNLLASDLRQLAS